MNGRRMKDESISGFGPDKIRVNQSSHLTIQLITITSSAFGIESCGVQS